MVVWNRAGLPSDCMKYAYVHSLLTYSSVTIHLKRAHVWKPVLSTERSVKVPWGSGAGHPSESMQDRSFKDGVRLGCVIIIYMCVFVCVYFSVCFCVHTDEMGRERWQEMCWSAIRGCRNRKWERAARSTICVITLSKQPRADDKTLLPLPFTQTHLSLSLYLSLTSSLCLCLSLSFS